jgi:CRP-like cAMP-binding protein
MTTVEPDPAVLAAVRAHTFLAGLSDDDVEELAGCGQLCAVGAGEVLAREGRPADGFYLIVDGRVAVEVQAPHAGHVVLSTVGAGEVLGWSWRFPPHRWFFDAVAVVDTTAVLVDVEALRAVLAARPALDAEITGRLGTVVTQRLREARKQLLDLYGEPR